MSHAASEIQLTYILYLVLVMDASIVYDIASLICALFVLEKGADVFVDHTVVLAGKTGIPQSAIALLTAGAEWEEVSFCYFPAERSSPWWSPV